MATEADVADVATGTETTRGESGQRSGRPRKDRKNAHGEGSFYFVEGKGLWRASLMVGRKADGRPDRRLVSAKSQKECRERDRELEVC